MKLFTQSATLLLATGVVLIIVSTPLAYYMAPILGFVIIFSIIYAIIKRRTGKGEDLFAGSHKEVFAVILAVLMSIFLTGGLNSNLFFLLYFLLFGIVFLYEPEAVFILLLGLMVVFFQLLSEGDLVSNLIKLGSLAFLSPVSYFLGKEFQKRQKLEHEIEDKTGQILEDAETLLKAPGDKNEEDIEEIDDIIEKSNELRREAEKE